MSVRPQLHITPLTNAPIWEKLYYNLRFFQFFRQVLDIAKLLKGWCFNIVNLFLFLFFIFYALVHFTNKENLDEKCKNSHTNIIPLTNASIWSNQVPTASTCPGRFFNFSVRFSICENCKRDDVLILGVRFYFVYLYFMN